MSRQDLRDPTQWIPRDVFAAYCGASSDKLLAYYDKAVSKRKLIVFAFDWLAFLLLPAWLGYRRQWTLWGTLVGVVAGASIVTALARIELPAGAFGGGVFALGLMAQGVLLANANSLYLKLKKQGVAEDAIRAALADKAKPHVGFAFAGLVGALAVQTVVAFALP